MTGPDQSYSGHVDPGGTSISRVVDVGGTSVEVRKLSVGPMDNNAYVLRDLGSDQALLVDAANDAERLLEELDGLAVVGVVTTHGHGDHWQALDAVADRLSAPVWLHPADQPLVPRRLDRAAEDGASVTFGDASVRLLHTPGHTPGSTCLLLGDSHLFTGDTLFPGGLGRSTPETFPAFLDLVIEKVFDRLDDATWIYPGHGDDTTIGRERPSLKEWRDRGW